MRKLLLCIALCLGVHATAGAEERPEVSRYIKAFVGQEGVRVWLLRMLPQSKQAALLKVEGVDHAWDRRVLRVEVEPMQSGERLVYVEAGKRYTLISTEGGTMELQGPGIRRPHALTYSGELSASGNAQHFLTEYLEQKPAAR